MIVPSKTFWCLFNLILVADQQRSRTTEQQCSIPFIGCCRIIELEIPPEIALVVFLIPIYFNWTQIQSFQIILVM